MTLKRAINLARVSTPQQAKLYSLDYQLEQMRAYDAEVGLTIVAEFKDDHSGRTMTRDCLEEACQMLERNEADVLVTWKFDRLHRNYVNSVVLRDRIRRAGKEIHYAQTRQVSGRTARERLPEDLQYIMAEIDADTIAENTQGGKRRKVEVGGKWLGLNKPPYGYISTGRGRDAAFAIDEWDELRNETRSAELLSLIARGEIPAEVLPLLQAGQATAVVIRLIFAWYVYGGQDHAPLSTPKIAKKLTTYRIPTPADIVPERAHLKRRGFAEWGWDSVHRILREDAYNGTFFQYKKKSINGSVRDNPNRDEYRGVEVPRLVDEDTFLAAQAKLTQGRQISARGARYEYLMGRRIRCVCGYMMRSTTTPRTFKRISVPDKTYYYANYRCPGKEGLHANRCDQKPVRVDLVDRLAWEWVKEEIANPEILERKLREIQGEQQGRNSGKEQVVASLEANRERVETELKRLATLYAKQAMPEDILDDLIAQENHKLTLTKAEIARLRQDLETPMSDETIKGLVAFSAAFQEHLATVEDTFEGRRTIIDGLDVTAQLEREGAELKVRLRSILKPLGVLRTLFASS
jgi:site-specific DNA recombinase